MTNVIFIYYQLKTFNIIVNVIYPEAQTQIITLNATN